MMYLFTKTYVGDKIGTEAGKVSLDGFSDASDLSGYAVEAMKWAYENKIIDGFEDGTLLPKNDISRVQSAKVLSKLLEVLEA